MKKRCLGFSLCYIEHPSFRKFQSHFILALKKHVVVRSGYSTRKAALWAEDTIIPAKCRKAHGLAGAHPQPGPACTFADTAQVQFGSWTVVSRHFGCGHLVLGEKVAYLHGHEAHRNSRPWGRKQSLNYFLFTIHLSIYLARTWEDKSKWSSQQHFRHQDLAGGSEFL